MGKLLQIYCPSAIKLFQTFNTNKYFTLIHVYFHPSIHLLHPPYPVQGHGSPFQLPQSWSHTQTKETNTLLCDSRHTAVHGGFCTQFWLSSWSNFHTTTPKFDNALNPLSRSLYFPVSYMHERTCYFLTICIFGLQHGMENLNMYILQLELHLNILMNK